MKQLYEIPKFISKKGTYVLAPENSIMQMTLPYQGLFYSGLTLNL